MTKTGFALAISLALATQGCVQQAEELDIAAALPTSDGVRIALPTQATAADGTSFVLGETAEFYRFTRDISRVFNGGAAWVLIVVHTVVQYPPTTVEGNVYTWGPASDALDPVEWKLVVTDDGGAYDWHLDGRAKADPGSGFLTLISGRAIPGATPHRGHGELFLDLDAAEAVNPDENDGLGTISIAYDLENRDGTAATLDMHIESYQDGEPVSADYSYAEDIDGSGELTFELRADLGEDGTLNEDAAIRSRWLATGAGRADATISGGDLAELTVAATECWDETFGRVFYGDSEEWEPTEGDESACVFGDAPYPSL